MTLWLAPEHLGDRSVGDVVDLVSGYQRLFLGAPPTDGDDAIYKAIVVVFTDLSPDRAEKLFGDVLQDSLAVQSYVDDGFVMGGSYEGNEAGAIYNPSFRPFTSPVPFLLIRQADTSDWKFFLDDEAWLNRWAQRYGGAGAEVLAEELRLRPPLLPSFVRANRGAYTTISPLGKGFSLGSLAPTTARRFRFYPLTFAGFVTKVHP